MLLYMVGSTLDKRTLGMYEQKWVPVPGFSSSRETCAFLPFCPTPPQRHLHTGFAGSSPLHTTPCSSFCSSQRNLPVACLSSNKALFHFFAAQDHKRNSVKFVLVSRRQKGRPSRLRPIAQHFDEGGDLCSVMPRVQCFNNKTNYEDWFAEV